MQSETLVDCEISFSVCQERCVIQYRLLVSMTFLSSHTSIKGKLEFRLFHNKVYDIFRLTRRFQVHNDKFYNN